MKLRTRKFLAGLLSLGLLLQAASPLSALAAETASSEPTLTVEIGTQTFTVSPTEDGKAQVNDLEAWKEATGGLDVITYTDENNTYTFHGEFNTTTGMTITGNGNPSIVMDADGTAVNGSLTVTDVKDVILTKEEMNMEPVVVGDVNITCTGDVRIKNNCTNYTTSQEMEAVSGSLTVKTSGDVKIRGMVNSSKNGSAVIDATGVVELSSPNGPVSGKGLTVKNASYVGVSSRKGIFGTQSDLAFEDCTLIELKDDYATVLGRTDNVTISPDSYQLYAGYNESSATQKANLKACGSDHYIRIETGVESQAKPVATLTVLDEFSSYYTTVTYILNRYEDGSVSWKNGQKPWGDDVEVEYNAAEKTYVFTGTLSELAESNEDRVTMICSDKEDSILIKGNVSAATLSIGIGTDTSGAKNLTIQSNSTEPAVRETITLNCSGDVSITNPSGAITGSSGDSGVYCYGASQNFTITGNSTGSLTGDGLRLYAKKSVTVENISGPVTGSSFSVTDEGSTAVKIIGNSSEGLMQSSDATAEITAATLTMENKNGTVGKVKFTRTDTTSAYRVAVGESESSNTQIALTDTTYSATVKAKYLNVQPGTPENTTPDNAELKITAGGNDYRIDPKDISEYGKEYTIGYDTFWISYHSEYDEFDIYGTVPDGTRIEGIGTHRPALQMTASTAGEIARPLTYGSLTIKNMGDVDLNGVIDRNLTIENVKDVSSGVVGYAGSGNLIINGAENVKYLTHVFGTIDINCTGEVNIYGSRDGSVSDGANITAKSLMMKSVSINGSVGNVGYVKFTRTDTASNYRILTGKNADTITSQIAMNGATFDKTVEETYLCIEPGTPHQHTASTEWKHDGTNHWHDCTTCEENVQLEKAAHNFGEDGKAEKCEECGFANPDYVAPDPDDTGTVDSGSDAGGAVAAVIVGGAAVWGGYEIATRVILHNILPEGAEIPANRGQLALLVWNTAGRPEPVNTPAFADVADADTAKAAQWCVEQGLMDAKSESTFKPEGWMPKFKTIEVWEKAFPKQ